MGVRARTLGGLEARLYSISWRLVQPFFPEIPRGGARSLLSFGGVFSHALLKEPSRGDFRSPTTIGAMAAAEEPAPALLVEPARAPCDNEAWASARRAAGEDRDSDDSP
ncbi:hypothetical protein [Sorangium sp. So ce341]|uniref:hypothetical protein n=1 Tax=Sorangium sp. So ce341 TaxID=3133302 RepID=UPI003F5D6D03